MRSITPLSEQLTNFSRGSAGLDRRRLACCGVANRPLVKDAERPSRQQLTFKSALFLPRLAEAPAVYAAQGEAIVRAIAEQEASQGRCRKATGFRIAAMFTKILVPIDLAEEKMTRYAVGYAEALAKAFDADIRLVNVQSLTPIAFLDYTSQDFNENIRSGLRENSPPSRRALSMRPSAFQQFCSLVRFIRRFSLRRKAGGATSSSCVRIGPAWSDFSSAQTRALSSGTRPARFLSCVSAHSAGVERALMRLDTLMAVGRKKGRSREIGVIAL